MKLLLPIVATALLVGCAAPVTKHQLSTPFNPAHAQRDLSPGTGSVKGSALIRQRGGGVVTCAGNQVSLIPATGYAAERMIAIYSSSERGFNSSGLSGKRLEFIPNEPQYASLKRDVRCDAQGFFRFENVANGEFFLVTTIVWRVNDYVNEGGSLMQRVNIQGGSTAEVVLTP